MVKSTQPAWDVRVEAARELAAYVGDERVFARLVQMLTDDNSAVAPAAADTLILHAGQAGLIAVLSVLGMVDRSVEPDDDIGYGIEDRLIAAEMAGYPLVREVRRIRDGAQDPLLRSAAGQFLERLDPPPDYITDNTMPQN